MARILLVAPDAPVEDVAQLKRADGELVKSSQELKRG